MQQTGEGPVDAYDYTTMAIDEATAREVLAVAGKSWTSYRGGITSDTTAASRRSPVLAVDMPRADSESIILRLDLYILHS